MNSDPRAWAEETFGACQLGDIRRTDRVVAYASLLAAAPGSSMSEVCKGDQAAAEGAYRLLENPSIAPAALDAAACAATAHRCRGHTLVLAIQDTTTASYTHAVAGKLGECGSGQGFLIHTVLGVRAGDRRILGVLEQKRWTRPASRPGKHTRKQRPYRDKESYKWQEASERVRERVGTTDNLLTVCDREADIYPYLEYHQQTNQRYVIRACQDRLLVGPAGTRLWEHMRQQPVVGTYELALGQRGPQRGKGWQGARKGRSAQTRHLQLRLASVQVLAPKQASGSLGANVVHVYEPEPPEGSEALEWMLLTSERISTIHEAHSVIGYYECRWLIEEYHKVWKTGCRIEQSRLQEPDNLERLLAITAHVAARMLALRFLATSAPDSPCTQILSKDEWQCLYASKHPNQRLPASPPSIEWALRAIGNLGGWLDTKRTGIVGWQSLWRGWLVLKQQTAGWRLARAHR